MNTEENNNTGDDILGNLDATIRGLKSAVKVEDKSAQFYNDMEWSLLLAIMKDPSILSEIVKIIPDPKIFKGLTDYTSHSLIYQAFTNLHDDGKEVFFESVYAECEKICESSPMLLFYSRGAIMGLDFWALVRKKYGHLGDREDNNRIRAKFCAEQVLRRK